MTLTTPKNTQWNPWFWLLCAGTPLWCVLVGWMCTSSLELGPTQIRAIPSTDSSQGGHSKIRSILNQDQGWIVQIQLEPGAPWPNAGVYWQDSNGHCPDLSSYDHLEFELQSALSQNLTLVALNGRKQLQNTAEKERTLYHFIATGPKSQHHSVALKDFFIPEWLVIEHGLHHQRDSLLWTEHCAMGLFASNHTPKGVVETLSIQSLRFVGFHWTIAWILWCLVLIPWALWLWTHRPQQHKSNTKLPQIWEPVLPQNTNSDLSSTSNPQNQDSEQWERCVTWLAEAYRDPELTTESAAQALGMPTRKFAEYIKAHSGLGPKEYVSRLRMEAAKRLLATSTLQIQEVAYAVGFNSVPHFNRAFKSETGHSPGEYRSQHKSEAP